MAETKRSKKAGLPPGSMVHIGEKRSDFVRINVMDYNKNKFSEKEIRNIEECKVYKKNSNVTWINVSGIHKIKVIEELGKCFSLHPLLLEDILNTDQRPKMEEYEGVVILATNLRENMDEAFTRRIRFIVEFPFPDAGSRMEIWKTHFPREAPVGDGIDYEFLAEKYQIAGGNIKNIVLNAAFLAAEDGRKIKMEHILHGTRREYEKIGKLWKEQSLFRAKD